MLGYHRPASETPFQWRFAGVPMMARFYWYLDPPSPHKLKKLSGSVHGVDYSKYTERNF